MWMMGMSPCIWFILEFEDVLLWKHIFENTDVEWFSQNLNIFLQTRFESKIPLPVRWGREEEEGGRNMDNWWVRRSLRNIWMDEDIQEINTQETNIQETNTQVWDKQSSPTATTPPPSVSWHPQVLRPMLVCFFTGCYVCVSVIFLLLYGRFCLCFLLLLFADVAPPPPPRRKQEDIESWFFLHWPLTTHKWLGDLRVIILL